jgi:GH18 family chitinase
MSHIVFRYPSSRKSALIREVVIMKDPIPRNAAGADERRFKKLMAKFRKAADENLEEDERLLMERIAQSAEAFSIFGRVAVNNKATRLLSLCAEAHDLLRTFHPYTTEAREV